MIKIALLGCGNIGGFILKAIERGVVDCELVSVFDKDWKRVNEIRGKSPLKFNIATSIDDLVKNCDLVIEAASQKAVRDYAVRILEYGRNLMILSVGALSNENLLKRIKKIATERGLKIYIPSGAVVGVDGLKAGKIAGIDSVSLITRKPPNALDINTHEEKTLYNGTAREGVKRFPANVNVAATLGLAGVGLEKTRLMVIADPKIDKNIHEIHVTGDFGEFKIVTRNLPSPENPKTSYIAALSAVAVLKRISSSIEIGT